jgi:ribonuclease BN (tRNA processing enzyme)
MQTVTISSIGSESTFCFHHETGILFDCGEGTSILLGDKVADVKTVYLSDNRAENINGLKGLLEKNKSLNVRFPIEFNGTFMKLQNELKNMGVWAGCYHDDVKPLPNSDLFIRTFKSYRTDINQMCYSSVIIEKKRKLKEIYRGKTPQEVAEIKKVEKKEVSELVPTEIFCYSPGVINQKYSGASSLIVAGVRTAASVMAAEKSKRIVWTRIKAEEWHESVIPTNKEIPIPPIYIPHQFSI